ncbi:MAG: hypothetical protein ABI886_13515 [Betaproteobacteria bacterium]
MRDDAGFGTGSAATARPSPAALIRFYLLRGVVTAMTMLSAVLLPWLVYTATKRIDLAGLVMLGEAAVRLSMSLYGGQLAHAIGGRVSFAGAQALCAAGFALFAAVLVLYPTDFTLAMTLLAAAIVVMQAGITLGNVVTEACTIALLHSGAAAVPARVRGVDLVATGCALPLGGWLVLAFDAPLAVVALGLALATGAAVAAARGGAVYDHANARIPARLSLVDRDAWRWLAGSRRTISLTLFLLAASVPITMLFGALPFLLGSRSPVDLPGWLKPTDVLFLTHYKALESIAAALVLWQWARWAGKAKDRPAAVHAAFAGYLGSLVALIAGDSAVATAFAAIALAASFSPLMVWVRTERAALVPEHNRQRVSGLLVAIDSTAYLAGALAVRYVGFDPAALTAIAAVAALLFISLQGRPELAPAARAGALVGLPPLAVKLARYRDYLALHRDIIETRLAAAVPRLGLVKRAVAPPTWTTPLAVAPATALSPIGVGLTPIVLPRALRDAGVHTARLAASAEEFAALHRPLADVRADAVLQGWSPRVLAHLLPDTSGELQSRMRVAFHRLRVDTLLRPAAPGDGATAAARFAPIEVNNGGSQGHWIASQVNRVLLAGLGVEERKVFDNPDALVTEVYEAFVDWLAAAMAPSKFARAFGRGAVPLAFVSGPYSGRMVNDVEGPRIAEFVRRRYGVAAGYFVGFANLELGRTVGIGDRAMALVKRRGRDDAESFAVWSDLYVTDCMDYVAAAVDSEDPKTRALARAFLEGRVVGISAWPGRELIENDKAHLVDKARARAMRGALGLGVADAALLEQAAPPAFPVSDEATVVARLVDEREQWVVKARFGCGGGSVIVGAKPSWPTQTLPHVGHAIAGGRVTRVSIADLARDAGVTLVLDDERRIDMSSWRALWPHLMQFVARSPGHYVAQARVEPAVFEAVIFDGKRIDSFAATTDFAAAFTVGWHGDVPRIVPTGTLCRAVPAGHPHTNITSRGALVPVMCEDEFDRLYVALGLHRETATATDVVRRAPPERISSPVPA